MSTISIILLVLVVLIAAILIYAATRPDTFRVERTATIQAPPEKVFPLINDFQNWGAWSPWENKDPAMKRSRSGPPAGKGTVYEWEGNKQVGQGRMEIIDTTPPSLITIKLDFLKPFEAHNTAEFRLEPKGNATQVTWTMRGPSPFMFKLMGLFMNMDQMVGKDFEAGLASMKAAAEA
ncbi:SRPBCC family protein [Phreatobacter stygius]|uniref:Polyketide cyclase n=1 Tax=Phreatobacter stygius TaxID=1940610 RepID=A0A4D7B3D9_9HYPH|nr:SRPBCC family protein [Phreatobacter stygius]QCI67421.1 polyketide cyclase [Phreatobacter stygius]